ncbi:MAG: AraC family transcriptional regulator [Bacilli bacterium]|nr:AraC family transcriptional regulator [Bacilli bacterium]
MRTLRFEDYIIEEKSKVKSHFIYHDYPEMHNHNFWECFIVYEGSYIQTINGEKKIVKRGNAYLIRPEDVHNTIQNSKVASHLNISFDNELMNNFINALSPNLLSTLYHKKYIEFDLNDIQMDKILEYTTLLKQDDSIVSDKELVANTLISIILNIVVENHAIVVNDKPRWLIELINKINLQENMSWTVKDVINEASYSHSHLTREFKKILGCTIVEYLTKVKMSNAIDYLIHSDKTISEISYMLGYDSVSHLNHIFKEKNGISPLQFRKKYRNQRK